MISSNSLSIVLVGIGGYGNTAVNALFKNPQRTDWRLCGVVDPMASQAPAYDELKQLGVPFFADLDSFYSSSRADLAIISSPIMYHASQTCTALTHGTHVLCEKPACATLAEARQMTAAQDIAGCVAAIGYQWSYAPAMLALKDDIQAGLLGRPQRLRTLVLWPRTDAYYGRNNWAGALQTANGAWVLDSPAHNACAHYLHNMLYVLGDGYGKAAQPDTVQAELYRANQISNFDTAALRVITDAGVEVLFYATHAVSKQYGPEFIYEFEEAQVTFRSGRPLLANFKNGQQKNYGTPDGQVNQKYWDAMAAVKQEKQMACTIETATPQVTCINAAYDSVAREITEFPKDLVYKMGVPGRQIKVMTGLAENFQKAWQQGAMPAEINCQKWSKLGKVINTAEYQGV